MSAYHKDALQPDFRLAEYVIESVLGHGGFGITYLAKDKSLGARVAIKEYLPHEIAIRDEKSASVMPALSKDAIRDYQWGLKQFVKEARALARFKHTNIVRVLRFLEANGTAYTVMEYEKGQTLAQYLKEHSQRLDEPALLRIVMPILNGLHAVHDAGMLHLDIKPENIYLRDDGNPMLIDFGSARQALSAAAGSTRIALTHGYAPIEQYPDKGKLGPWSDLYALGATMYRCVTGKRPDDSVDRYRAMLDYKVDPLRPAEKTAKKNYQPLLLNCIDWAMQIHAKDRPQTARELQDGLMGKNRALLSRVAASPNAARATPSKPIAVARPQLHQAGRPRSTTRGLWLSAAVLALVVLGVVAYWTELLPSDLFPTAIKSDMGSATGGQGGQSKDSGTRPGENKSNKASANVADIPPAALSQTLLGHTDWIQAVQFSPNGTRLASAGADRSVRVWDVATGAVVGTFGGQYAINALAYAPDGKRLAAAAVDGSVTLWDTVTGRVQAVLRTDGYPLYALAFIPSGNLLAAAGKDRLVRVWDLAADKPARTFEGHQADIYALAYAPDGTVLASAGGDRIIRLWNAHGTEIGQLAGHKDTILALAFSPNGRWLISGDAGHTIRMWDTRNYAPLHTYTQVPQSVLSLVFSRTGVWFAAAATDSTIYVLESESGQVIQTLPGHEDYVQVLALSPDGTILASGGRDRSVRLWRAKQNSTND